MSVRISNLESLLPALESSLRSFTASSSKFSLVRNVNPAHPVSSCPPAYPSHPRTLFILDSSYNPPSLAHFNLAIAALRSTDMPRPHRLLLLLSTANADKAPKPASFEQRLAMMTLFAEDLQSELLQSGQDGADGGVPIDIGLTTRPFYTDKSSAITQSRIYASDPTHVHLLGYDTLIRFLAPKYYASFHLPLSALAPFFGDGHSLRVLLRPESLNGEDAESDGLDRQRAYVRGLSEGALVEDGFQTEWARQISVLDRSGIPAGISSTKVREAAKRGEWDDVEKMCSPGVTAWVKEMGLYREES